MIETADNFIKYAKAGAEQSARERAVARYRNARELAAQIGDADLASVATLRISDLERDGVVSAPAGVEVMVPPPAPARRSSMGDRIPPGQVMARNWPVLHEGRIPSFDGTSWPLKIMGEVERPTELTYAELRALAPTTMSSDFHCVTGWSRLENTWDGVWVRDVLARVGAKAAATTLMTWAPGGYGANLPLDLVLAEGFLAWGHDGEELAPEHGWPLRLVVPSRYAWKSVKWVQGLELLAADRRGFWEMRGYHNRADPWKQERYAYQET